MQKVKIKLYYQSEIENLDKIVSVLNRTKFTTTIKTDNLKLAGLGVYLFNFYNGIENILKRVLEFKQIKIKNTSFWHKELLQEALKQKLIDEELHLHLLDYLSYRHFFVHGYAFNLDCDKIFRLIQNIKPTYTKFKDSIQKFIFK